MKDIRGEIAEAYSRVLASFLSDSSEAALQQGYELGRRALRARLGLLQMVDIHQGVLSEYLRRPSADGARASSASAELLAASLAPFEMTHRGFEESIARLKRVNQELKDQTSRLEALNGELEAFSYSVSHDLRAPLRAIDGFTQVLAEDYSDRLDEAGKQHLARVRQGCRRMNDLIDDLLKLSRVSRQEFRMESVDLVVLGWKVIEEFRKAHPERTVEFSAPPRLPVNGDPGLLEALLENLLGNAWKFTRRRPSAWIELTSMSKDGETVFVVRDNGAGFDMRYVAKLFGAFQRLHSQEDFPGTGIGLATVQRIVRRHGGRIWAEAAVDQGASFYFTLESKP